MRTLLFFFFFTCVLTVNAQVLDKSKIVSSAQGLDTATVDDVLYYYKLDTFYLRNETPLLEQVSFKTPKGDSATAAQSFYDATIPLVHDALSGFDKLLLLRSALQIFNQVNPFFTQITGYGIIQQTAMNFNEALSGSYTVYLEDNTSFAATIEMVGNALKLIRTSDSNQWSVIALSSNEIRVNGFDHDLDGSNEFWIMKQYNTQNGQTFLPIEYAYGKTDFFRIVKDQ